MIELTFSRLHVDNSLLVSDWEKLIRIVADFSLVVEGRPLFAEEDFTVVELAQQLVRWLRNGMPRRAEFSFTSLETDETGWLLLEPHGERWRIGSVRQTSGESELVTSDDLAPALVKFIHDLKTEVHWRFGVDLTPVLER